LLSKEDILSNLQRLGELLKEHGLQGEIILIGGAAMCLVHSARDMTKDVDALYAPKREINQLVAQIADERGLPEDWLNDGVKGFVTEGAPSEDFMTLDGLKVMTVTPEYLLAMKLLSARYGEKDAEDVCFLLDKLQISNMEEASELLLRFYPVEQILPKTRYLLEEYFADLKETQEQDSGPTMRM
jgi:predicted nucleotidyltransferase